MEERMQRALRRFGGSRTKRLLRHPYRSLAPLVDRRLGRSRPATCPTFYGAEFHGVLPEAVTTQVWRTTVYSPDVCRALIHMLKPGDTFMDIGAHFGFFSLFASHLVGETGRTVSVEAMPGTFAVLKRNMQTAEADGRATLFNVAAADTETTLVFKDFGIVASSLNTAFENRGASSLIRTPKDVTVTARTGDALLREAGARPDLIKIDAESSELLVLKGLEETIREHRPALVLELGDDPSAADPQTPRIWERLTGLGYRPVHFEGPDPSDIGLDRALRYANVLFLPDRKD
ncbi:methyltransferase, FkbM family protein [Pseudooceanicola batsensis HTCC2597]|uniref:Methyltransferase, FkbM family protein n=1 Tax=Pseudooceanicola batsensis (strain ATCC BAA-863 / DSM 15984 / KCTC 12145 / HTCC2597) TaxID=252305 RepID=A3TY32_PSEBH|nr:methyltransferase, FkbM family protein [Pseudooceanicola batsensis HTCC2597]